MNRSRQREQLETRLIEARRVYQRATALARSDPEAADEARRARRQIDATQRELARLKAQWGEQ